MLNSLEEVEAKIEEYGFLPFFANSIPGFSIEEMINRKYYFGNEDGIWEWKGPIALKKKCIYGKFFNNKAVFISKKWVADFINWRRDGYDFDARYDDHLVSYDKKAIYDLINEKPLTSKQLKEMLSYGKNGNSGFDGKINYLMMKGYICIKDFVYAKDKHGKPYGWGISQYTTIENQFGANFVAKSYKRDPNESYLRIRKHLIKLFPEVSEELIDALLKDKTK